MPCLPNRLHYNAKMSILSHILKFMTALVLGLIVVVVLYSISSGPVLAYHCRYTSPATAGICQCYLPLFRAAPELASRYAVWCGASEIEAFLLLKPFSD